MGVTENELDALWDVLDQQHKKGHIPFWSSWGNREEDQDTAEIEVTQCWAEAMNKHGWRIDVQTIRINEKNQASQKSIKPVKLDPPDCLAEMDGGKTIGVEVSMLVHPQARHYWKLPPSVREIPWIEEPGLHVLDQWKWKPAAPNTYPWTPELLQKKLNGIVKNKNQKIENKGEKDPSVLSRLSKLFLVIPMDEAWLDGTLGKNKYWTVEGQIVEVPRPRSIDGVYMMGQPRSEDANARPLVSEVRLAE